MIPLKVAKAICAVKGSVHRFEQLRVSGEMVKAHKLTGGKEPRANMSRVFLEGPPPGIELEYPQVDRTFEPHIARLGKVLSPLKESEAGDILYWLYKFTEIGVPDNERQEFIGHVLFVLENTPTQFLKWLLKLRPALGWEEINIMGRNDFTGTDAEYEAYLEEEAKAYQSRNGGGEVNEPPFQFFLEAVLDVATAHDHRRWGIMAQACSADAGFLDPEALKTVIRSGQFGN